jgi:hypothetical protein
MGAQMIRVRLTNPTVDVIARLSPVFGGSFRSNGGREFGDPRIGNSLNGKRLASSWLAVGLMLTLKTT